MNVPRYQHSEGHVMIGRNSECLYAGYAEDAAVYRNAQAMKLWREEALAGFPIVFGHSRWKNDLDAWQAAHEARITAGLT